jgi:hypothetical protein
MIFEMVELKENLTLLDSLAVSETTPASLIITGHRW